MDHIDATGSRPAEPPAPVPAAPTAAPIPAPAPAPAPAPPAAPPAPTPAAAPAPRPAPTAGERDSVVRLSKIRKLTGDHMVMSKSTSPHAFSVVEVDFA